MEEWQAQHVAYFIRQGSFAGNLAGNNIPRFTHTTYELQRLSTSHCFPMHVLTRSRPGDPRSRLVALDLMLPTPRHRKYTGA